MALLLPMLQEPASAEGEQWVPVGKPEIFLKDQPQRVALPEGRVIYVTRRDEKTFLAVSAKCTHRGCELGWDQPNSQLLCPCHGAAFAPSGKNLHGTSRHPEEALPALQSVPTRQKEGQVEVNLQGLPPSKLQP